jgi:hypothetical protein
MSAAALAELERLRRELEGLERELNLVWELLFGRCGYDFERGEWLPCPEYTLFRRKK